MTETLAKTERDRVAWLSTVSNWDQDDRQFMVDALRAAWDARDKAIAKAEKAEPLIEHHRSNAALIEDNFAKFRRESAERHFEEIRRITELAGDAAKAWNKMIAAKREGRKTVRIADLLDGTTEES